MSTVLDPTRAPATVAYTFTSESVSEGHPDKVCDTIADSILDAHLAADPASRVACEVLCKENNVVLAGEITSNHGVNYDELVREVVREIGYVDADQVFRPDNLNVHIFLSRQAAEIAQGVDADTSLSGEQGAGDQGIMFGYATDETPELMPLPILLAHRLARSLATHRKNGAVGWLRPDSKTQVSVRYENGAPVAVTDVLVSTQHSADADREAIRQFVALNVVPEALGQWYHDDIALMVNPTGSFVQGGPSADAGVTGRKIIVDSYGGMGRHGGGAFSGKDPSKVDRSGAYFCRFVARQVVKAGLARRAEVQVAYAIGVAQPVSVKVDTFGTGDERAAAEYVRQNFDFRPGAIVERLNLLRPIYRLTTNYGHFGKPELPWEE
ncbi:methionine adenosyltransferase [Longimicrobium sp.]|uniref:methionine adenosyltransferase n=1 Tax=Longimicrobium sp. TaxID=2029185 RepID=UPI002C2411C3|nr:methionine adenosyltransferase [Longimicrobium sp.]HSU15116.1 methionine adenosyltransferase [Longimicrobium sp.]